MWSRQWTPSVSCFHNTVITVLKAEHWHKQPGARHATVSFRETQRGGCPYKPGGSAAAARYFRWLHKEEGLMSMKWSICSQLAIRNRCFHVTWKFKSFSCYMRIENKSFRPVANLFLCIMPAPYNSLVLITKHWLPRAYIIRTAISDLKVSKPTDLTQRSCSTSSPLFYLRNKPTLHSYWDEVMQLVREEQG